MTSAQARADETSATAPTPPNLIAPLPAHRLDEAALFVYLGRHLDGFANPLSLRQFQGGKSNPTYLITTATAAYVLRKKPPGEMGEAECLDIYCRRSGRVRIENWAFYLGFSMLRSAGIAHGVDFRALTGNAADSSATDLHRMAKATAELGWEIVNRA